jgi:hypothetical protein
MKLLPALGFLVLGLVYFLVMTSGLSKTSEGALVEGSMGLVPGILGAFGALFARSTVQRAIVVGIVTAVVGAIGLVVFYQVLWPLL